MERWQDSLEKAKQHFQIADHMAYVTFTLLKENRLIMKILLETAEATNLLIKAALEKAEIEGKIRISKNPYENMKNFTEKIAPNYLSRADIENIIKCIEIRKKHVEAHIEFVKKDKFVILLGDKYESLTIDYVKGLMSSVRKLLAGIYGKV